MPEKGNEILRVYHPRRRHRIVGEKSELARQPPSQSSLHHRRGIWAWFDRIHRWLRVTCSNFDFSPFLFFFFLNFRFLSDWSFSLIPLWVTSFYEFCRRFLVVMRCISVDEERRAKSWIKSLCWWWEVWNRESLQKSAWWWIRSNRWSVVTKCAFVHRQLVCLRLWFFQLFCYDLLLLYSSDLASESCVGKSWEWNVNRVDCEFVRERESEDEVMRLGWWRVKSENHIVKVDLNI